MGQQQSKDELLYRQVSYGSVEGIKALHREGAGLEYVDIEGKTPLIAACMNPTLYNTAKTLVELGANVNAYRRGSNGGTPLHHASKGGLESAVKLLLSHGANALLMNDDHQTPLDIARANRYSNVVRAIESHICVYSGWLREVYGPEFLQRLAPQLFSRKIWVVIMPCGSRNLEEPLELAIYATTQAAQPRTTIGLCKASMEEPAFNQPHPAVIISEASTDTRIKFAVFNESDKQQLQQFCSACKGIAQVSHPTFPFNTSSPVVPATAPPAAGEDLAVVMAINASLQSALIEALIEGVPFGNTDDQATTGASSSANLNSSSLNDETKPLSAKASSTKQPNEESGPSGTSGSGPIANDDTQARLSIPSAPIATNDILEDGSKTGGSPTSSSSCVICFDAPVEGACVPCGHMAGCMSCLNEIKVKNWGCPVCRTKIDQVIRVYAV